ncbi:MAG TPA: SDR family oxidoreductase [Candidatus Limnocylindrales bacterium]|nr:SDR family oxidoreductase [Candidatus Limnocylindrales bacterium]
MSGRFEGRVCLITGSTGIAAAAAAALADEGARVFVASRTADHARDLAERIGAAWSEADLTQEGDVQSVVERCVETFGRIDCVYNVAGISARRLGDGALHEMTLDGWRAVMDANATSQFLVCRAAVRQMLDQEPDVNGRRGTILNMGSVTARHPVQQHFATHGYAASKGAIESLSRSIAVYYAPHGIRVNVIAPGLVATPMSERAQTDEEIMAFVTTKQPLAGGAIQPDALVGAALYLLSDDSRMVSGQVVTVDGGWSLG